MSRAGSQITCTRQDVAFAQRLVQLLASAQAELCHSKTRFTYTLTTTRYTRVRARPAAASPGAPQSPSCAGISKKYFNVGELGVGAEPLPATPRPATTLYTLHRHYLDALSSKTSTLPWHPYGNGWRRRRRRRRRRLKAVSAARGGCGGDEGGGGAYAAEAVAEAAAEVTEA